MTRSQLKLDSACRINSLTQDQLWEYFQITRVGEITGLDRVGVPVWAATRPCGKTISVTAGKNLDSRMARAGAIAEAIEYATFENPQGPFHLEQWSEPFWPAKGSDWSKPNQVPVECVTDWTTKKKKVFPSQLVWLGDRVKENGLFQRNSNGNAVAGSFYEAFLSGLYECVERDAITIRTCAIGEYGRIPPRQNLAILEGSLATLRERIASAGLKLFLFHCSFDILIPVYWAIVIDPCGDLAPFAGWGANLDSRIAAERAILEALQSRLVYISGARDDIQRRNFDLLRNQDPSRLIETYESLPQNNTFGPCPGDLTPWAELSCVLDRLGPWRENILFKHIELPFGLHAVKTMVLGLEAPITLGWQPGRWLKVRKYYEMQNDNLCGSVLVRSAVPAAA